MIDTTPHMLTDFNPEDIKEAKKYVKKACLGYITSTIDYKVDMIFKDIENTLFTGQDIFHICFDINTIGNDLLAALGAARNEREQIDKETI